MENKKKYLYCLADGVVSQDEFRLQGLEGQDIEIIGYEGISCLISQTEREYYPLYREYIIAHERPIEEVMEKYDVLPFSFSSVADSEEKVRKEVLQKRNEEFRALFKKFKGKVEMGLRAFWPDTKPIFQEIAETSPEIRRLKKTRLSYQQQIAAGTLAKNLLERKRDEEAKKIIGCVKNLADDFKEQESVGETAVLSGVFLIKKGLEEEFLRKVRLVSHKFPNTKFDCYGPFPLYNFANIKIHLI